jgi:hypothetical protein
MDFALSTIGLTVSTLPSTSFIIGKRRRLAPASNHALLRCPVRVSGNDRFGDAKDTLSRPSLLSQLQDRLFSSPTMITKVTKDKSWRGKCQVNNEDDDDDTASTVSVSTSSDSTDEEEEDCSCSTATRKSVSFSYPLVTKVHVRPNTSLDDKYYLHYSDIDFIDFKIGYITGKDRTRKVSFARDVVSDVTSIPPLSEETRKSMYYSEPELQRFLDEFVQSLHQRL